MTARTHEMEQAYQEAKVNGTLLPITDEVAIQEWKYWKLVNNRFPHNKLVTVHQMIVLKRASPLWEITTPELKELWYEILPWADDKFDFTKLNMQAMRSINAIPHLHLCIYREEYR